MLTCREQVLDLPLWPVQEEIPKRKYGSGKDT